MEDYEDDEVPTTVDRLMELLRIRDKELHEARETNGKLKRKLEERKLGGNLRGGQHIEELPDDGLSVPRLELVYIQVNEWHDYVVVYRLVMKHLMDHLVAVPLSSTVCTSGGNQEPTGLPFRDGAHAVHDSAHLRMPVYKIMPGKEPTRIATDNHESAWKIGQEHRRE